MGNRGDKRTLDDRRKAYPSYQNEFGHLEGDTIIGKNHKSAVITFAERVSKLIIGLETPGHKAEDIEWTLNNWFNQLPKTSLSQLHLIVARNFPIGKV